MSDAAVINPTDQPTQDSTVISEETFDQESKDKQDKSSESKEVIEQDSKPEKDGKEEKEEKTEEIEEEKIDTKEIVNGYYDLQKTLYKAGKLKESLEMIEKIIQISPISAVFNLYGERLLELNRYEDALSAYNKALELNPKNEPVYSNKGYVLYLIGRQNIVEANAMYDKGLELFKDDFITYMKKGKILIELGQVEEAKKLFDIASDIISQGKLQGASFEFGSGNVKGIKIDLNKHEVELVKLVNELKKIPDVKPTTEEDKDIVKKANEQKEAIKLELLAEFAKRDEQREEKYIEILNRVGNLEKMVEELKRDNRDAGVKAIAEMKRNIQDLEKKYKDDKEVIYYYKTFYWTVLNLLQGYRQISTGLNKVDYDKLENGEPSPLKIARDVLAVAKYIPFVKDVIGNVVNIVEEIVNAKEQDQINAINKIIRYKFNDESEINVTVMKLAYAITMEREQDILEPEALKSITVQRGTTWLMQQLTTIKQIMLDSNEFVDPKSPGAVLALQDSILLIAYMSNNWKSINASEEPLDKQIEAIIRKDGLESLLEKKGKNPHGREDREVQLKCISCNVF